MSPASITASTIPALIMLMAAFAAGASEAAPPIRALYITGGGWHDYPSQQQIITQGLGQRTNIQWTIENEAGDRADHWPQRFTKDDWIKRFDVVVYNFCITESPGAQAVEEVVQQHVRHGIPAVFLHCAIHSFRAQTDRWFEFGGLRSHRHEAHRPFTVEVLEPDHPIMAHFPARGWRTPRGELYEIAEVYETATPLARAYGQDTEKYHETIWVNEYRGVRVFGTTIGHHNETTRESVYLDFVTRGLLWAVDKLNDDGTAAEGYEGEGPKTVIVDEQEWHVLFNGRNLDGWRPADENPDVFRVAGGKLVIDGPRSHLYYDGPVESARFRDFHFRSEVYTYPRANSGIFFHTRWQASGWPAVGYEAQVNATHRDRVKTGSIYGVSNVYDTAPHKDHEWFLYEIIVRGGRIVLKVDGEVVMDYTERPEDIRGQRRLSAGTFALQAHDPGSRMYFRNIYVRPLDE